MLKRSLNGAYCIGLLGILAGCAAMPADPLFSRLAGRGAVMVSPDNPYVAANLLLGKESERSEELRGFLKVRGLPQRLTVGNSLFGNRTLTMHYQTPTGEQKFFAEQTGGTWVISQDGQGSSVAVPEHVSMPTPTAVQRTVAPVATIARSVFESPAMPPTPTPTRAERIAQAIAQCRHPGHSAELSPTGDLIHYVVDARERLSVIAVWYTGEVDTSEALARLNGKRIGYQPQVGDTIVIPKYLVKNREILGTTEIDCLSK